MMITIQVAAFINMLGLGVQEAACVLVGNLIGANNVPLAKRYARMTFTQSIIFASVIATLIFAFRDNLCRIFSDDETGIDVRMALAVIPIFTATTLVDMCQSFFVGLIRALGIQSNAAIITILSYYLLSVPAAVYLAFFAGMGIRGLWIGYFFGILIQAIVLAWLTLSADWQEIAAEVQVRFMQENEHGEGLQAAELEEYY